MQKRRARLVAVGLAVTLALAAIPPVTAEPVHRSPLGKDTFSTQTLGNCLVAAFTPPSWRGRAALIRQVVSQKPALSLPFVMITPLTPISARALAGLLTLFTFTLLCIYLVVPFFTSYPKNYLKKLANWAMFFAVYISYGESAKLLYRSGFGPLEALILPPATWLLLGLIDTAMHLPDDSPLFNVVFILCAVAAIVASWSWGIAWQFSSFTLFSNAALIHSLLRQPSRVEVSLRSLRSRRMNALSA